MRIKLGSILGSIMGRFGSSKLTFYRDRLIINSLMNIVTPLPLKSVVQVDQIRLNRCDAISIIPSNVIDGRQILFNHGGAMCFSMWKFYMPFAAKLAEATRSKLLLPDYRLSPEHPFPAAVDDCRSAHEWIQSHWGSTENTVIVGDSAGGNLALNTALSFPKSRGLVLLCPWIDLTHSSDTWSGESLDNVVFPVPARRAAWLYVNGGADWTYGASDPVAVKRFHDKVKDPAVSPVHADLESVRRMPALIQVGAEERLLGDSLLLWERLGHTSPSVGRGSSSLLRSTDGVHTLSIWPHVPHVWQITRMWSPPAKDATSDIASFINDLYASRHT